MIDFDEIKDIDFEKIQVSEDILRIDRSRLYLVEIVREICDQFHREDGVSSEEVREEFIKRAIGNTALAKKFYLGYGATFESILDGMSGLGLLDYSNGDDVKKYKLTDRGKNLLDVKAKDFSKLGLVA